MNITFITNYDRITYKHYLEQPMPIVERLIEKSYMKILDLQKF